MKKTNALPKFKSYEEEAKFWDTHDFSEFWNDAKPIEIEFLDEQKREGTITIRVQPKLKDRLEKLARGYGINLSTLARMWLIEKLRQTQAK